MREARKKSEYFRVLRSRCGQLPVVLGSAPARVLAGLSFADVLDEERELGYQRPFDARHSRDFRAYIERPSATTIPLTFNLRGGIGWELSPGGEGELAELAVKIPTETSAPVLAQVDCQHRLGAMADSDISLTFQCFLGLSPDEEMAIFSIINGKAKGLSSSLLDYHSTKLEAVHLGLRIAKALHNDPESVWYGKVKLGGKVTQGTHRHISLRGLQSATKLLLQHCPVALIDAISPDDAYQMIRAYWRAVSMTLPEAWTNPRSHLIVKGVGVNALSLLAGEIISAGFARQQQPTTALFREYLAPLRELDWKNKGTFRSYGGRHGANQAHEVLSSRVFKGGLALVRAM